MAGGGHRLRTARARGLRPGRAGAEPVAPRRLFPPRPRPDPQPATPEGAQGGPGASGRDPPAPPPPDRPGTGRRSHRGRDDGQRRHRLRSGRRRGRGMVGAGPRRLPGPHPDAAPQRADRHGPRRAPLLGRIVEHGKNYLVPRDDGRILIGASEEDRGYDTTARRPRSSASSSTRRSRSARRWPGPGSSGPGPDSVPAASTRGPTSAGCPGGTTSSSPPGTSAPGSSSPRRRPRSSPTCCSVEHRGSTWHRSRRIDAPIPRTTPPSAHDVVGTTRTLPAASSPSAIARSPIRSVIAPASARFSATSPRAPRSRPDSVR